MKLCYRGQSYEYTPNKLNNLETAGSVKLGCQFKQTSKLMYRGISYINSHTHAYQASAVSCSSITSPLIYRESTYFVNSTVKQDNKAVIQPVSTSNLEVIPSHN